MLSMRLMDMRAYERTWREKDEKPADQIVESSYTKLLDQISYEVIQERG